MTTDLTTAKIITYNRDTRDFDATFDGNYIGSFRTMHQAECELNQHVLSLCEQGLIDQPLAALAEQALTAALADDEPVPEDAEPVNWSSRAAVPEGTDPDDFSDVGPERAKLPIVVPNPGLHLSSYTVYDRPGQHGSRAVHLCDDCATKRRANGTMATKWSGECINGYCDDCKAGPSVSHFRLVDDPPPADDDDQAVNWSNRAPNAGQAIARQWHRDRARFLSVLSALDRDAWQLLAAAYSAYMARTGTWIAPEHIIRVWTKAVDGDIALPARAHLWLVEADASAESYAGMTKALS